MRIDEALPAGQSGRCACRARTGRPALATGCGAVISFIIPARNEARLIGATLAALDCVIEQLGQPCEVIVVDDASTDGTGERALEAGARLLRVGHRHI